MKRLISFVLVLIIFLNSVIVFANGDISSKLKGHWSENIIEKDFVAYYFPYLAKNNFEKLEPSKDIIKKDFSLSLRSLSKDYNLDSTTDGLAYDKPIKRIELANFIGVRLSSIEGLKRNNSKLPFKDINNIEEESIQLIRLLYDLKIINGVSAETFAPNKMVTQAEAIVILQRMKGVLEDMKEISFEVKGVVQSYNSQENVIIKEKENSILVTITKQFATPGYFLGIDKILKEGGEYKILLGIIPPAKDVILPQVITYKTITIEIAKEELRAESLYNFTVEGIKGNLIR